MAPFRDTDEESQTLLGEKIESIENGDVQASGTPANWGSKTMPVFVRIWQAQWLRLGLSFIAGFLFSVAILQVQTLKGRNAIYSSSQAAEADLLDMPILQLPGDVKVSFEYDDRYPGPPTPESEQEWLNLLPNGLGFVQHDRLEPGIVDFSAFHQLHCLMALRHAIYDSYNATEHSHMTPHHVRHCLEYLRQGIMCNADANTERRVTFEDGRKFTPGWEEKKCRDYEGLKKWAEEWRVWDGKIPSQRVEVSAEVVKGRVIHY